MLSDFLELMSRRQRRGLVLLLILMLIGTILEMLSIGLALPALTLLTQQDTSALPAAIRTWLAAGTPRSAEQTAVLVMLTLVAVFLFKTLFLALLAWRQSRFVFRLQADLSQQLFELYLYQPYTFHLQRNTAELIRNVVNETNVFTQIGLLAGMLLLTELMVLVGLAALLLWIEPVGAFTVTAALAAAGWGFHRMTRSHLLRWGNARQHHEGLRIQHLQQGLGGAKDVKLLGREAEFLSQYSRHNVASARVGQRQNVVSQLPRLWLELLAVAGLATLVVVVIAQGKPLGAALPTIGLFTAAAFRLMPSANRLLTAAQHLRYAMPVVHLLHRELRQPAIAESPAAVTEIPFARTLRLDAVTFTYPGADRPSLENITIEVEHGASVGFVGGSGAGKSTLVDVILGLLTPDQGSVTVDGVSIAGGLRSWQSKIGYVPQSIFLTDDTLRRNIAFGLPDDQIDEAAVLRAIRSAQLDDFVAESREGIDTIVGERGVRLSGGQRQRIGIARALYHDPAVLVLDEATSSLDIATEHWVMEAVRALHGKKTILIVAHRHSTVEHCDKLYRLEQGKIVDEGSVEQVLRSTTDIKLRTREFK